MKSSTIMNIILASLMIAVIGGFNFKINRAVASMHQQTRDILEGSDSLDRSGEPARLVRIPGIVWPKWHTRDSLNTNGFRLLSQDDSNMKSRIVSDTAMSEWTYGLVRDSLLVDTLAIAATLSLHRLSQREWEIGMQLDSILDFRIDAGTSVMRISDGTLWSNIPSYADETAARNAGLVNGHFWFQTSDGILRILN